MFARWTKVAGTAEELSSLRYVQAEMDRYGYRPQLILHDAYISLPGRASVQALDRTLRCITHSFSRASGSDGLSLRQAVPNGLEIVLHAQVDTGWRKTPILIADMDGPVGGDEAPYVLFSGHHDTWYYGVMDNGGANATMMEVAHLCSTQQSQWQRGLRVAFWSGHSQGRYSGSAWYADEHWEEIARRCVAHVNVDSTGGAGNTIVADTGTHAELAALAREAVKVQAGQALSGHRMGRAGDESFWGIGIPAMFGNMGEQPASGATNASATVFGGGKRLGHGTGWWWHTPDDLLDKIDETVLVRDTRIYLHAVWRLVSDLRLPLDWEEHATYLLAELASLGEGLEGRFDLAKLVARAERLRTNAAAVKTCDAAPDRINAALLAVARALVPIDYSSGDRFGQDPALAQSAYPSLQSLRVLAQLSSDSPANWRIISTSRRRPSAVCSTLSSWPIRAPSVTAPMWKAYAGHLRQRSSSRSRCSPPSPLPQAISAWSAA